MEKAECLNDYFVSISTVDDSDVQLSPFRVDVKIHYQLYVALLVKLKHLLNF